MAIFGFDQMMISLFCRHGEGDTASKTVSGENAPQVSNAPGGNAGVQRRCHEISNMSADRIFGGTSDWMTCCIIRSCHKLHIFSII
jgi:hypothetical protein